MTETDDSDAKSSRLRVLIVVGTRPEAIKLAPVLLALRTRPSVDVILCTTGQHREMLDQSLRTFNLVADRDLDIMTTDQSLSDVTAAALQGLEGVIEECRPDVVLVQGDTASALAAALAAFYRRVPVGHVEAGLRTNIRRSPFPEEVTRRLITQIAELHFAPTARAAEGLSQEGATAEGQVFLTGNTVVDAVLEIARRRGGSNQFHAGRKGPLILVTAHRRENFGEPIRAICRAVRGIVERHPDVEIIYPVHLNPNIQQPVREILGGHERIHLVAPMDYVELITLIREAFFILTDSGGLQEEALVLGKPVLVLRRDTERPEAIEAGGAILVGTDEQDISVLSERLMTDADLYHRMANAKNPFGDGFAAMRIATILTAWHEHDESVLARLRWTGGAELSPYDQVAHA